MITHRAPPGLGCGGGGGGGGNDDELDDDGNDDSALQEAPLGRATTGRREGSAAQRRSGGGTTATRNPLATTTRCHGTQPLPLPPPLPPPNPPSQPTAARFEATAVNIMPAGVAGGAVSGDGSGGGAPLEKSPRTAAASTRRTAVTGPSAPSAGRDDVSPADATGAAKESQLEA